MTTNTPTVLITGAARRIGAVIARQFHAKGYNVVLHFHRSEMEAQALADTLNGVRANSAQLVCADLVDMAAVEQLAQDAGAAFGRIDVLVNNASSFYPTKVGEMTLADWDDLLGTNLKAPLFLSQALLPMMTQSSMESASIINIVDIHAERPMAGYSVYNIAKAGLAMLTKTLAQELAPKVRVNGVAPGAIIWPEQNSTVEEQAAFLEGTPMQRIGTPEDIAHTAVFLAEAAFITGQVIAVDGGKSLTT